MTWGVPVALAGVALLALPILIHLMGLGRARTRQFPSLRFLEGSRLVPSRRTRVHDAMLLFVRLMVLVAAVVALARPLVPDGAAVAAGSGLAVAIIVDTSASVQRATLPGGGASDGARGDESGNTRGAAAPATADSVASGATTRLTIFTADPAAEIPGAAAWLRLQAGDRELVLISDFQVGSVAADDFASVPPTVAIRTVRIPLQVPMNDAGDVETVFEQGAASVLARATVSDGRTQVAWVARPGAATGTPRAGQTIRLAAPGDESMVELARLASRVIGRPADDAGAFAIVYPGAPGRADLVRNGTAPREIWQGDAVRLLQGDSLLAFAANEATPTTADSLPAGAAIIARARTGEPIVAALADSNSLVLLLSALPASPVSVALNAAVARVAEPGAAELDPGVLSDSAVRSLERDAGPTPAGVVASTPNENAPSYARWFWIAALVALVGEAVLRRALTSNTTQTVVRDVGR